MTLVQPIQHVHNAPPTIATPFNDTQLVAFVAAQLYGRVWSDSPVQRVIEIVAESLARIRNGDLNRAVEREVVRLAEGTPNG